MLSLLDAVKQIVPKEFTTIDLEAFLKSAEDYAEDSEFSEDSGNAKEFVQIVDSIRGQYSGQLKGQPELEKRIKMLSLKLHWMYGLSLDTNLKSDLVSLNLVETLKAKVDVLSGFTKWLNFYEEDGDIDEQRRSDMMYLLSNNSEWIGNNKIDTAKESLVPTVQNWIKDFLISLPANNQLPTSFDKVNYFTKNPNVQKLSTGEKDILSKIIDIYRYLKNPNEKMSAFSTMAQQASQSVPQTPRQPVAQAVVAPIPQSKEMTAFEKKLADISAAKPEPSHGVDLEVLKHRMEASKPAPVAAAAPSNWSKEIKREVTTKELPAPKQMPEVKVVAPKPVIIPAAMPAPILPKRTPPPAPPKPVEVVQPVKKPVSNFEATLSDIKNTDDLKRISLIHIRRGPIEGQVQQLKKKILDLAHANRVMPYYVLTAFEESPLFRAYLNHGNSVVAGNAGSSELTTEEFEAIADLRKEIQRL